MHTFMVPCLLGLEKLVGDEIRRLGLKDVQVENGRVLCRGQLRRRPGGHPPAEHQPALRGAGAAGAGPVPGPQL